MITEDFVSFENAKLLKEKGFNWMCRTYFIADNEVAAISTLRNFNSIGVYISAPTLQMVMKWLREVHSLAVMLSPQWAEGDMRNPCKWLYEIIGLNDITADAYNGALFDTYEEACDAAIKYCLENLI